MGEKSIAYFIRKNTKELKEKLEGLGFIVKDVLGSEYLGTGHPSYVYGLTEIPEEGYDCGENEGLFLALSRYREDTDSLQLFTDGEGIWSRADKEGMPDKYMQLNGHKASKEEIIRLYGGENILDNTWYSISDKEFWTEDHGKRTIVTDGKEIYTRENCPHDWSRIKELGWKFMIVRIDSA